MIASRIYSFLDEAANVVWQLLDGRKLIADLATRSRLQPRAFSDFRDAVLTFQLLQSFLKTGEGFGLYLDSEEPNFCLKLETNSFGHVRAMVVPHDLVDFPSRHSGTCRLIKTNPRERQPYTSVIELRQEPMKGIINKVLEISSQFDSYAVVSLQVDQSLLLHKLPGLGRSAQATPPEPANRIPGVADPAHSAAGGTNFPAGPGHALAHSEAAADQVPSFAKSYFMTVQPLARKFLDQEWNSESDLSAAARAARLTYLGSGEVRFACSCSRERMVLNLQRVYRISPADLEPELTRDGHVKVTCDYCLEEYAITRAEVQEPVEPH